MTQYWAFLSDPDGYHYDTLFAKTREVWDGVTSAPAQAYLRRVAQGDEVLLYHTSPLKSAYGCGRVLTAPYPDPGDPAGKRVVVDIAPVARFAEPVTLAALKAHAVLSQMRFVRMPRCAVSPVTAAEWAALQRLAR